MSLILSLGLDKLREIAGLSSISRCSCVICTQLFNFSNFNKIGGDQYVGYRR